MPEIQPLKTRLAKILYEKSYLEGEFTLSSGCKSDYYFDCRQSSLHPEGVWLSALLFMPMLEGLNITALAGMTLGADPLVTAASLAAYQRGLILPALIVRKEPKGHGTGRSVEGLANVRKGDSVAVLEDVVSTGGSVLKACKCVEDAGLRVASVLCILDREEPGTTEAFAKAGHKLQSIFTRTELLTLARG